MRLEINRVEGLRNDLLLRLERNELEGALLSVANRERLMTLPGIPRHRESTEAEQQGLAEAKVPLDTHLRDLGIVNPGGRLLRRAVAISNRNLGTNHGHVAWQRSDSPHTVRILEDPGDQPAYSCLVNRGGALSIEDLRFDFAEDRILSAEDGRDLSHEIEWATFGQQVLRGGRIARIDEIAHQFYDVRHVLAFDDRRSAGEQIRRELYRGYPATFKEQIATAWRDHGVPRARYVHNAVGVSPEALIVIQREGTIEEIGAALHAAGAHDGVILDNGGSVACWVWWANVYAGGIVSPTVDYRPAASSAIAFLLKGPMLTDLPGGSVSYTVA